MKVEIKLTDESGNLFGGEVTLVPLASKAAQKGASTERRADHGVSAKGEHPRMPMDGLRRLHQQGAFKAERDFQSVEGELSGIHCNFPKASLAKALARADFLTRHGSRGSYRWIQRYPAGV
jgi:hypothetical protein